MLRPAFGSDVWLRRPGRCWLPPTRHRSALQARYDEETLVLIVTTAVLTLANNYWNNIVGTPIDDYLHDGHYVERELDIQKAAAEQK